MAISIKHKFQSAKADGPDSTVVQPSDWNDEHDIVLAGGKVLGRATGAAGAVQELPLAFDSTMQSVIPPTGTTAQRPALPVEGMIRFNSTTSLHEIYRGGAWGHLNDTALGQTWQNLTGSRGAGTVYRNTTGRSITWALVYSSPGAWNMQVSADSSTWITVATNSTAAALSGSVVIPTLWYYRTTLGSLFSSWAELR